MTKISFIYYKTMSSFIGRDFKILSKYFCVDASPYSSIKDAFRLFNSIRKSDISFSWFAGGHAALAVLFSRILRKPSIVVLGGYETAKCPDINYGATLSRWRSFISKFALKYASRVLSVDESLIDEAKAHYGLSGKNMVVVPTGYDFNYFVPFGLKESIVLTVSPELSYARKGVYRMIEMARKHFPDVKFVIVGNNKKRVINNVEFTGRVTDEELLKWYQRAKVYCQLSVHEGLPNALCEAMLCECVPIGTRVNGIPKAIEKTGFLVGDNEYNLKYALDEALKYSSGIAARQRIKTLFPEQKREEELLWNVEELIIH